jgi:hypothetical protein
LAGSLQGKKRGPSCRVNFLRGATWTFLLLISCKMADDKAMQKLIKECTKEGGKKVGCDQENLAMHF